MSCRTLIKRLGTAFLSVLLLLFLTASSSCAEKDLFSYQDFYDQKEFEEVLKGRTNVLYGYKLHDLKDDDIRILADPDKVLEVSDEYEWILAMDQGARTEMKKENEAWVYASHTSGSGMGSQFLLRTDILQEHISSLRVKNIVAFRTRLLSSETAFVYIKAKEGEFLVPFSTRPDWTEMKNGKLYTREEIAEIVSKEQSDILKRLEKSENGEQVSDDPRND